MTWLELIERAGYTGLAILLLIVTISTWIERRHTLRESQAKRDESYRRFLTFLAAIRTTAQQR